MKTIYLNIKTSQGVETVDEFSQEKGQNFKEFRKYVNDMVREYHVAEMGVYKSGRCTKVWKKK
jgi:hypothetical protein